MFKMVCETPLSVPKSTLPTYRIAQNDQRLKDAMLLTGRT